MNSDHILLLAKIQLKLRFKGKGGMHWINLKQLFKLELKNRFSALEPIYDENNIDTFMFLAYRLATSLFFFFFCFSAVKNRTRFFYSVFIQFYDFTVVMIRHVTIYIFAQQLWRNYGKKVDNILCLFSVTYHYIIHVLYLIFYLILSFHFMIEEFKNKFKRRTTRKFYKIVRILKESLRVTWMSYKIIMAI